MPVPARLVARLLASSLARASLLCHSTHRSPCLNFYTLLPCSPPHTTYRKSVRADLLLPRLTDVGMLPPGSYRPVAGPFGRRRLTKSRTGPERPKHGCGCRHVFRLTADGDRANDIRVSCEGQREASARPARDQREGSLASGCTAVLGRHTTFIGILHGHRAAFAGPHARLGPLTHLTHDHERTSTCSRRCACTYGRYEHLPISPHGLQQALAAPRRRTEVRPVRSAPEATHSHSYLRPLCESASWHQPSTRVSSAMLSQERRPIRMAHDCDRDSMQCAALRGAAAAVLQLRCISYDCWEEKTTDSASGGQGSDSGRTDLPWRIRPHTRTRCMRHVHPRGESFPRRLRNGAEPCTAPRYGSSVAANTYVCTPHPAASLLA